MEAVKRELKNLKLDEKKHSILLIEDEPISALAIKDILSGTYNVIIAGSGAEGILIAQSIRPKVILLDLNMPGLDGFEVCDRLRSDSRTKGISIMVVTAHEDLESRVRAFNLGADDFLIKPFQAEEIIARVHSKIRRVQEQDIAPHLTCGNLVIDEEKYEATIDGRLIDLSLMEINLLKFLVKKFGQVLDRRKILEEVWKGQVVSSRTIDSHVLSLRKKVAGFSCEIVSMYGVGYGIKEKRNSQS